MRVYVESNFVLELVLEQTQWKACRELMDLAARDVVTLAVPALALVEPYNTLSSRNFQRRQLNDSMQKEFRELARTATLVTSTDRARIDLELLLVKSGNAAMKTFSDIRSELTRIATVLPTDVDVLQAASNSDLSWPDAIMLATVMTDCTQHPGRSCFLNRNSRDFDESIGDRLTTRGCKLLASFDDGLAYVRSQITDNA